MCNSKTSMSANDHIVTLSTFLMGLFSTTCRVILWLLVFCFLPPHPLPFIGQHLLFPAVALWVTVGLAICLIALLGALAYVCQKKIRQSCKEEQENAGNCSQSGILPPLLSWYGRCWYLFSSPAPLHSWIVMIYMKIIIKHDMDVIQLYVDERPLMEASRTAFGCSFHKTGSYYLIAWKRVLEESAW